MPASARRRAVVYLALNGTFLVASVALSMSRDGSTGTLIYLVMLFALCTAPILLLDGLNGRYALLGIFTAMYFVFFGALDATGLLLGGAAPPGGGNFISEAELGILCGAAAALLGYRIGVALVRPLPAGSAVYDWRPATILIVGMLVWLIGSAAIVYFQVFIVPEKTNIATARGLAALGPVLTFAVMLGQMIEPMGLVILAYGYARYRSVPWLLLVLTMVAAQVAVGFVSDIKAVAMLAGILVILARLLIDNRLPKGWMLGGAVLLLFSFPLFQAYRADVVGARGLNHFQALMHLDKVLEVVIANRDKVTERPGDERSQTFFERASLKGNVEMAFEHTGIDTPFRQGDTLVGLLVAFIPRLIWPDKPDVAVGQLFNKEFIRTGDPDTYISPSHLGELYWNFGWPGILFGMTFIGALLGFVAAKCNMAEGRSVTRLLVLLATVKYACLGFEGSIAIAYIVWLRSLGAIALLHLMLARQRTFASGRLGDPPQTPGHAAQARLPGSLPAAGTAAAAALIPCKVPAPRYPNLLR
ncbi:MAG TPA: hypothetical protein VLX90_06370 [Steroidobacteraceae bacterium]|nr:hypothetical protein [Steroidobacteraceae bacterium]